MATLHVRKGERIDEKTEKKNNKEAVSVNTLAQECSLTAVTSVRGVQSPSRSAIALVWPCACKIA